MTTHTIVAAALIACSLFAVRANAQQPAPEPMTTDSTAQPAPTRPVNRDHVMRYVANDGKLVTVVSGQPHDPTPPPKPPFEQLDVNHDGIISRDEAQAYLPLFNDYDNLVHHVAGVTPRMYARWDQR